MQKKYKNAINNQELTQEEAEEYILTFGKYKGMTLKQIEEKDHKYIEWIMYNTKDERLLKIIELTLGYAVPSEEEQEYRLDLIQQIMNMIDEKEIDFEKLKTKFNVESVSELDTKTLKELVVYLEGK